MRVYELDPLINQLQPEMAHAPIERVGIALHTEFRIKGIASKIIALTGSTISAEASNDYIIHADTHDEQVLSVVEDSSEEAEELPIIHTHHRHSITNDTWWENKDSFITVSTFHGPADKVSILYKDFKALPNVFFTILSSAQEGLAEDGYNIVGKISNGVETDYFTPNMDRPKFNVVTIGRICPEKNQFESIQACKIAGERLIIAGPITDRNYFDKFVRPHIDQTNIIYLGNVKKNEIKEILDSAKALLMPVRWEDACPLVVLEALAMGVPTIAYARGGLIDQVRHEETGYLVSDVNEIVDAIKSLDIIDRASVRHTAEKFYDWKIIANAYASLFKDLLNNRQT